MERDRLLARVAAIVVLVTAVHRGIQDTDGPSLHAAPILVAILAAAGAFEVLRRWTPDGYAAIRTAPLLLVPIGIRTGMVYPLAWIALLPGIQKGPVLLGVQISAFFVIAFAVEGFLAGWQTVLVLRAAAGEPLSPWGELREAWRLFPRAAGLCLACGLALSIPAAAIGSIVFVVPWTLFWNFFTAAVLVWGLAPQRRFGEALGHGTILSWSLRKEWWKPLLAQMVLLGVVTAAVVETRSGFTTKTSSTVSASALWTGGYGSSSRWIDTWSAGAGGRGSALVALAAGLVFGVLAVAIKIVIARVVKKPPAGDAVPGPTAGAPTAGA